MYVCGINFSFVCIGALCWGWSIISSGQVGLLDGSRIFLFYICLETYFPRWHRCFGGIWFKFPQVPTQPWGEPASGRRGKVEHYFSFLDHQFTVCCIKHSHIMNYDGKLQVDLYLIIFHPSMDSLASLIEEADIFASSRFSTKLFWTVIDFITKPLVYSVLSLFSFI